MYEASTLKLSFWNVFVPDSAIINPIVADAEGTEARVHFHVAAVASGMHKEIFGWRMQEDIFGGVADKGDRERLSGALFDRLAVDVAPEDRSLEMLRVFVLEAEEILAKGTVEWSSSQSLSLDNEEERRVNSLLALVCHLKWLIEVFDEQPNVSVTAR